MAYQVPKKDHPWRQYRDRDDGEEIVKEDVKKFSKPVKMFVHEMVESWESITIVTSAYGRYGEFTLMELPQEKQAAWLAGLLKRNYGN